MKRNLILAWALLVVLVVFGVAATHITPPFSALIDAPTITITTATADTTETTTTGAERAEIQWKFGTVDGTYTTCTVQAKTTYDGTNYLTLGNAASVTVTTGASNAWTLIAQQGTTTVTTSAVSATAALGFGRMTKYTFGCSGAYGTSAPVTISTIYQ